jgi:uncharacterized peroxidase-related enzyme
MTLASAGAQCTALSAGRRESRRYKMPFFPSMPEDATTKHVFTAHPEIYSHWVRVSEAILRGLSPLTPAQRELIGAYVSSLNACQYCYGGHRAAAELFGVPPQTIDGLINDLTSAPIDSTLRPIFAFVRKLTLTPTRMTQADAAAVFAAGWDEAALHSAIAVCCLFNFMNRLVGAHGIKADGASFAERGRKHVEMGYVAQYEAAAGKAIR